MLPLMLKIAIYMYKKPNLEIKNVTKILVVLLLVTICQYCLISHCKITCWFYYEFTFTKHSYTMDTN